MRGINGYEAYFLCWQAKVLESLLAKTNNLICAETVKRIIMGQANNCRLSVEQGYDTTWLILNCENYALGFSEKPPSMMTTIGQVSPFRAGSPHEVGSHGDRFKNPSFTRISNNPAIGGVTTETPRVEISPFKGGEGVIYTNWLVPKGAFAVGLDINTPSTRNICSIRLIKQSPLTVTTGFLRKHRYYLHEVSFSMNETLWGERYKGVTFVLSRTMKKSNSPAVVVVTADLDCEGIDERIFDIRIMTDPDDPQLRRKSEARRLVKAITNRLDYVIKDAIDEFSIKLTGYM